MAEPTDGDDGGVPPPGRGKRVPSLPADGLFPVIRHRVDAFVDAETGETVSRYDYFTYEFEHPLGTVGGRAYVHDIREVSLFGLARDVDVEQEYAEILYWLRLRFPRVQRFDGDGYVDM